MTVRSSPNVGLGYSAVARSTSSAAAASARNGGKPEAGLKGWAHAVRSIDAQLLMGRAKARPRSWAKYIDSRIYGPPTAGSSLCLAAYICCKCTGPHTRCLCQEGAPMLVKKYGNRRLYDTEESRYVRLDEIADRIRDGADVQVVDAKS